MEVYLEYVIIDNFLFDYMLLKLAHIKRSSSIFKGGIFYGATIGTVVAIFIPLIQIPTLLLFLIKIALGFLMLLVSAKFNSLKQLLSTYIKFVALTFVFGGAIYAVLGFLKIDYSTLYKSYTIVPLSLIILLAVSIYRCCFKFFCTLYEKRLIYPFVRECELQNRGKSIDIVGLIDSGNQLIYNNFTSVCIAGERLVNRLKECDLLGESIGSIEVRTVSGRCEILLYKFESIKIYLHGKSNIIEGPIIGIGTQAINLSEEYDLILSAEYLAGGEI